MMKKTTTQSSGRLSLCRLLIPFFLFLPTALLWAQTTCTSNGTGGGNWWSPGTWDNSVSECSHFIVQDGDQVDITYSAMIQNGSLTVNGVLNIQGFGEPCLPIEFPLSGFLFLINSPLIVSSSGDLVGGECATIATGPVFSFDMTTYGALDFDDIEAAGGLDASGVLPVDLIAFSGRQLADGNIQLNWTTVNEVDNAGFHIQRSFRGDDWEAIGFVPGKGTYEAPTQYQFLDDLPPFYPHAYYRLQQVDFDGATEYSPVIAVSLELRGNDKFLQFYPNPVQTNLHVQSSAGRAVLYNTLGQPLRVLELAGGTTVLDVSQLQPGAYVLQLELENGEKVSRRFIRK